MAMMAWDPPSPHGPAVWMHFVISALAYGRPITLFAYLHHVLRIVYCI